MTEEGPEYHASQALVPVEERVVEFYGDEIKGVVISPHPAGREVFVPVRPLCDFLGVDWSTQRRRILNDAVLSQEVETAQVNTAGGLQEMLCLPLDMLNGWLFSINANRVKAEIRERLIRYQKECYRVLSEAFQGIDPNDPLAIVEQHGRALITLAREQRELNRQVGETREEVREVVARVVALEDRVAPGQAITEEQAMQISQAVKTVAMKLSKKTGRSEYGPVYGELYRKFSVTSYKLIPAVRFQDAMEFLTEWHEQLSDNPPF